MEIDVGSHIDLKYRCWVHVSTFLIFLGIRVDFIVYSSNENVFKGSTPFV